MSGSEQQRSHVVTLAVAVLIVVAVAGVDAQPVELIVDIGDVTALPGNIVEIPVYMSNYIDTIAGFNIWVTLDRPDILEFTAVASAIIDTSYWECLNWSGELCLDSAIVGPGDPWDFIHIDTSDILIDTIDTTGCLSAGWQYITSRSLSGMGWDLNVVGIANLPGPPTVVGPAPQEGGTLIKLVGQVYNIPDSMTDRTANLIIEANTLDHFGFSDPQGNSIGVLCDSIPDTSFFRCDQWYGDICLSWTRVYGPPYDSIDVLWFNGNCHLDTAAVHILPGSVTVLRYDYGDADCSGVADIADLVYTVEYMFAGGPPMPCAHNVECDGDDVITVTDLICLVDWMFGSRK